MRTRIRIREAASDDVADIVTLIGHLAAAQRRAGGGHATLRTGPDPRPPAPAEPERCVVLASVASAGLACAHTDRVIVAGDGRLVFDGPGADFSGALASRRLHGVVG